MFYGKIKQIILRGDVNVKKLLCVLLCLTLSVGFMPVCFAVQGGQAAAIVDTVYPTDDVVLADVIATESPYSADPSGVNDSTAAIQKAIDDCAANGGGTVWLPAGRYRLTGSIHIRQFVTLRGDYQDPDIGTDYGTIIIADIDSKDAMTPGLITVGASAGAVGLTVWYPEQSIDNVKPYPYTFFVEGNGDYMLQTIKNCTLINSYRGIGASSECENGIYQCHEMLTIDNVKGTCLYEGLNSHNSADVDTVISLYILNKYWAQAGEEFNAPDETAIDAYTRANGSGLILGDLEWPQFADIRVSDMLYGMIFREGIRYCFSGEFVDLYITDCDYGMYVPEDVIQVRGKSWGIGVANGVIQGSEYAVCDLGASATVLTNVEVQGKIKGSNVRRYNVDTAMYTPDYDRFYTKPTSVLYTVEADKTGKSDASASVQAKLDEAAVTGGVVYLPGGLYRFDSPVTVPSGVQLHGSSSVAVRCQNGNSNGTLILANCGYTPESAPLITLGGDGAGLTGLRVDFYLNNPVDASGEYKRTAPAVYSEHDNVYVTNCAITLASCGIKLVGSENAYFDRIVGCCYESMFSLDSCKDCYIEGSLQNANTLPRTGYSKLGLPRITEDKLFEYVFIPITRIHTDYIKLNGCDNITVFNTFIYGGKTFLNSTDSTSVLINVGHDGSSKTQAAFILSGGDTVLINSMRSTEDGKLGYRFYTADNGARFRSYGSQSVDMLYREHVVLENYSFNELRADEWIYAILQPIYKLIAFFGRIHMDNEQG